MNFASALTRRRRPFRQWLADLIRPRREVHKVATLCVPMIAPQSPAGYLPPGQEYGPGAVEKTIRDVLNGHYSPHRGRVIGMYNAGDATRPAVHVVIAWTEIE
jgi:hypothetical protein